MIIKLNTDICGVISVFLKQGHLAADAEDDMVEYNAREDIERVIPDIDDADKDKIVVRIMCDKFNYAGYVEAIGKYSFQFLVKEYLPVWQEIFPELTLKPGEMYESKHWACPIDQYEWTCIIPDEADAKTRDTLKKYVQDNSEEFFKWCERYKSYDGFISHMPYREDDFWEAFDKVAEFRSREADFDYCMAMVMHFIIVKKVGDQNELDFYESELGKHVTFVQENGGYASMFYEYDDEYILAEYAKLTKASE